MNKDSPFFSEELEISRGCAHFTSTADDQHNAFFGVCVAESVKKVLVHMCAMLSSHFGRIQVPSRYQPRRATVVRGYQVGMDAGKGDCASESP